MTVGAQPRDGNVVAARTAVTSGEVASSGHVSVALCIITFMRPVGLARLLDRIDELDVSGADVVVVVVDNDPERSAEPIVEQARTGSSLEIVYDCEPERGITHARNRAVSIAAERSADWIGWIDDDEAPRSDWLRCLLETQRATGADVVHGPSSPIYESDAAEWIIESGVFDSDHFDTGDTFPFNFARTSGVIVRSSVMPENGFDNRLALSGGSDRVLFTQIHRAGGVFVWDDRAVVDEWIPASRMNVRWLIKRWFRKGVTRSLTLVLLDEASIPRRVRRVGGGVVMALKGVAEVAWAARRGRTAALAAAPRVFFGLGATYGALGRHYQEYRRTHGQ